MDDEELRTALLAFKDYSLRQQIAALESRVRELEAKCFNLEAEREPLIHDPLIHDLERHIAIAAQEADARLRVEAELESREPIKSQIKRISAMVESAEIKRLEAEREDLRAAVSLGIYFTELFTGPDDELARAAINNMRAALKG